jgi:hypothetical protein
VTTYRVKVSSKNSQSSVHAVACNVVIQRSRKEGVFEVEASSAKEAAAKWDAESEYVARRLPLTKVCPCCHE